MPSITALLHTENDALRLGRCLEMLYPCDNILIVDHASRDGTVAVAHEYGARIVQADPHATPDRYLKLAHTGWILCIDPRESLTEALAASLFEWKNSAASQASAFSVFIREETADGWITHPVAETRLIPQNWTQWSGKLPVHDAPAPTLEGELLRFALP
jgi:glycosyltransferase involved in cell wall biosynthesis